MKNILFLIMPALLFSQSPFDTPKNRQFNFLAFEKKQSIETQEAAKNPKIKCRLVCDKKIYKEQKISEAIEFYKNSKIYKFDYSSMSK
ncbi:hypothetical protein M947_02445 [Sulfurimonas hongkongensis]|uniref:Uncharacterized protein n=1 Tax=Sulfurimonas hongkongensis TaxID=1172190 RepID=T0L333_9BACT|nr:hypothetical protein [Sulfurimonas hongkongensis]EQB40213.1 hypothetical protein M947_02445 [Sulfurimonas hongkongensis]